MRKEWLGRCTESGTYHYVASTLGSNSLIKQNGLLDFGHLDVLLNFTSPG